MTVLYFAYGSNMNEDTLRRRAPSAKRVSAARLDGYRLAFTRRSARTQGGVADVLAGADFSIWGIVFELDERDFPELERKEGLGLHPPAYRRQEVTVYLHNDRKRIQAQTFRVAEPAENEFVPAPDYLQSMIDSMSIMGIGKYVDFLRWLQSVCINSQSNAPGDIFRRPGLLATRTTGTPPAHGSAPVVRISARNARHLTKYVALDFGGRTAIGYVVHDESIGPGGCALDQTIRRALGIEGQMVYGHTVLVERLAGQLVSGLPTRTLTLKLSQARISDAEKRICTMHQRCLDLLGLQSGEYVTLHRPQATSSGFIDRSVVLRCFAAVGESSGYPDLFRIYLDKDTRIRLGITIGAAEYLGMPILVRPSVLKAIQSRVVAYGITVLLGTSTFTDLASRFFGGLGKGVIAAIGLGVAVALTVVLAVIDLRSKLRR